MNMKKTALATAIALTIAGSSSVWAATSTVKGQFILDKTAVVGGETVNLALLGLDKDGKVDRFGESNGSIIMAVLNTIKGKIQCGSDSPGATPKDPDPEGGYFASEVKYARLQQGVGRCSIYYPNEIVGEEQTTDTVTVYLQERIPTGEGGVDFKRIGEAVDKTITIKAGISAPAVLSFVSFEPAPSDPLVEDKIEREANGLHARMTAGYEGAQLRVRGIEQSELRAANIIKLEVIDRTASEENRLVYSDTQRMVRGEALFTLTSEITKSGSYDMVASLEASDPVVNSLSMTSRDTLTVLPTLTAGGLKIWADKKRITKPSADACKSTFPHHQVCQGAKITLKLLDEYGNYMMEMMDENGNPTTSTNQVNDLLISFTDANQVVSNSALKYKIPAASTIGMFVDGTDAYLGNQAFETIKGGTTSLVATVAEGGSGITNSSALNIRVVGKSMAAEKAPEFDGPQKAGTEFNAFKVRIANSSGVLETTNPGAIVIRSEAGEEVTVNRNPESYVVEGYFERVAGNRYLISDQAGNYGQVWVEGHPIAPGAAHSVTLLSPIGLEVTSINPSFDRETKQYITEIPEAAFRMIDAYGNAITENVGDFHVSSSAAKAIKYVNTAGGSHGEPGRTPGGVVQVIYDTVGSKAFAGEDSINIIFNKPALSNKTFTVKTMIPAAVEEGLESIVSYIETNDLPVNSEVAMKVETLDKQGNLFTHDNMVVTVTFNENLEDGGAAPAEGEEGAGEGTVNVITPTVYELVGHPLTPQECFNATGTYTDGKCDIVPEVCIDRGYIFTEAQGCLRQEQKIVASGGRLTFKSGRKLFLVEAGPRAGVFSLTFKDANSPEIEDTRVFNVTVDIVPPPPPIEEPECLKDGNYWTGDGCKTLPPTSDEGVSTMVDKKGNLTQSTAKVSGGVSVGGGDFEKEVTIVTEPGKETEEFQVMGSIRFDESHKGEQVEILVVVIYRLMGLQYAGVPPVLYQFTADGLKLWNGNPADLEAYETVDVPNNDEVKKAKIIDIFEGSVEGVKNPIPARLDVLIGYRTEGGDVVYNETPFGLIIK